jgi:hypothetical protein
MAQIREEIHETTAELIQEAIRRGGTILGGVPRPIDRIAAVLGSHVERVSAKWLQGNKGLCTEHAIVVDDQDGRDWVRRFTIAHELGHQWLGAEAEEWECNAFAGSMLIPEQDVHSELQRRHLGQAETLEQWARYEHGGGLVTQLVRRYRVGYHAMIRALADYGWVSGVDPWTSPAYGLSLYEQYESFYRRPQLN